MSEHALLLERARRCRMLAGGLSKAEDRAVLNQLAAEYEAEARAAGRVLPRVARPAAEPLALIDQY